VVARKKSARRIKKAHKAKEVLKTWRSMMKVIGKMSEQELQKAFDMEAAKPVGEQRKDMLDRLHRRLAKVRFENEREKFKESVNERQDMEV
jgi:flagellin-specific chaperone FliS